MLEWYSYFNQQYMIIFPFPTNRKSLISKTFSSIAQKKAFLDTQIMTNFTTMNELKSREELEDTKLLLKFISTNWKTGPSLRQTTQKA